jgi:hypothetical protein
LTAAYLDAKDAYKDNRIDVDTWDDVEVAYERILRHHRFMKREFEGREPVGPIETIRLLKSWIPNSDERSRWFYAFNHNLGATPADLVHRPEGDAMVREYIAMMMSMGRDQPSANP